MAVTFKRLAATLLGTSAAQVYQATSVNTQIDACTITNTSGSDATVTVWLGGEASASSNMLLNARTLAANSSIGPLREVVGQVIPDGGALFASASVDGVVALVLSGREQATT